MFVSINTLGEEAVHLHDLHIFFLKKNEKLDVKFTSLFILKLENKVCISSFWPTE